MFTPIGSIANYVKQSMLQKNTTQKLLNFEAKAPEAGLFGMSEASQKVNSIRTAMISSKLNNGDEIGVEDLEYLRKNDPELYTKAARIVRERKEFNQRLRQCKTKEEALAVKTSKSLQLAGRLGNGGSGQGSDESIFWAMKSVEKAFAAFIQGPRYVQLPDGSAEKPKAQDKIDMLSLQHHPRAKTNRNAAFAMLKKQEKATREDKISFSAAFQAKGKQSTK